MYCRLPLARKSFPAYFTPVGNIPTVQCFRWKYLKQHVFTQTRKLKVTYV